MTQNSNKKSRNAELDNANLPRINTPNVSKNYRTQMCQRFIAGKCSYGDGCSFAHDSKDLRINTSSSSEFYRTQMCRKFVYGKCSNGDHCNYAHDSKDLRQLPPKKQQLVKDKIGEPIGSLGICYDWKSKGQCMYKDKCRFIHELAEVKGSAEGMVSERKEQPAKSVINVPEQEGQGRGFAKLANKKVIKGIYGDWIGDGEEDQVL